MRTLHMTLVQLISLQFTINQEVNYTSVCRRGCAFICPYKPGTYQFSTGVISNWINYCKNEKKGGCLHSVQLHTNAGAQLVIWYLQGGLIQSTTPKDTSPNFEDYCRSDLLRIKQKGVVPEILAWAPLSNHLESSSAWTLQQDAPNTNGVSPPCNRYMQTSVQKGRWSQAVEGTKWLGRF